jgi:hypothetical protein
MLNFFLSILWLNNSAQLFAIATQSGKGKKASLAMTTPFKSKPKVLLFQSLEVRHQLLKFDQFRKICVPFLKTIVLDFVFYKL